MSDARSSSGCATALADRLAAPAMNKTRYEERLLNGNERDLIVEALREFARTPAPGGQAEALAGKVERIARMMRKLLADLPFCDPDIKDLEQAAAALRGHAQAGPDRHTTIETAVRSYCRRVSPAIVQNDRIYYSGLSITDLVNDIEAALDASPVTSTTRATPDENDDNEITELDAAKAFLREKPSTSYLQRKMQITYNHACSLILKLEEEGFISKVDSAGRRTVLISSTDRP